jgi:hypothetical protein
VLLATASAQRPVWRGQVPSSCPAISGIRQASHKHGHKPQAAYGWHGAWWGQMMAGHGWRLAWLAAGRRLLRSFLWRFAVRYPAADRLACLICEAP